MGDVSKKDDPTIDLSLLDGGLPFPAPAGTIQLFVQQNLTRQRELDALVIEEDTFLVLSTPHRHIRRSDHPVRVIHHAYNARPEMPGGVIVRKGHPLRLLAVVHHLSYEPSFREEWIALALENIMCFCAARSIRSLGLPLLGSVYGTFPPQRFLSLLRGCLHWRSLPALKEIWLQANPHDKQHILSLINLEFGHGHGKN
jgi:hypothetical protein